MTRNVFQNNINDPVSKEMTISSGSMRKVDNCPRFRFRFIRIVAGRLKITENEIPKLATQ